MVRRAPAVRCGRRPRSAGERDSRSTRGRSASPATAVSRRPCAVAARDRSAFAPAAASGPGRWKAEGRLDRAAGTLQQPACVGGLRPVIELTAAEGKEVHVLHARILVGGEVVSGGSDE